MSDLKTTIRQLIKRANKLTCSPEQVELLEEAVRCADQLGDIDLQIKTRQRLSDQAESAGLVDKAIVAFTWVLGAFDRDPELFPDPHRLMYLYLHLAIRALDVPHIQRGQIFEILDDVQKRLTQQGWTRRAAYHLRWRVHMRLANFDDALRDHEVWGGLPRDGICYDRPSEVDSECELFSRMGRDEVAWEMAQPILRGELRSPPAVPNNTYTTMLMSTMRLGRDPDTAEVHSRAWREHSKHDTGKVFPLAFHLLWFVRSGDLAAAAAAVQRHLPWTFGTTNLDNNWHYYCACECLCRRAIAEGQELSLRLPQSHPLRRAGGAEVSQLAEWFGEQVQELGAQFDRRNGNRNRQRDRADFWRAARIGEPPSTPDLEPPDRDSGEE